MNQENDAKLCEKYPKIFVTESHGGPWGISTGDGWYPLIEALCAALQRETDKGAPQVVATDVKDKHGELRFYIEGGIDTQFALIEFAEDLSRLIPQ